jgi:hypothetical protein
MLIGALGLGWLSFGTSALAAERVILKYRVLQASVSVDELTELAETGEVSPALRAHLRLARKDPEELRQILREEVAIDAQLLDRVLNSRVGEGMLDQVGTAIYTPSRRANRQAMRSAIVLSAEDDDRISLLELMQNYPTEEVYVDGERLVAAYNQFVALQGRLEEILNVIDIFQR